MESRRARSAAFCAALFPTLAVFVAIAAALSPSDANFARAQGMLGGGMPGGPKPETELPKYIVPEFKPEGPQVLVAGVRVEDNETVSTRKIESYLKTRKDRAFDPEVVQADVRSLLGSGLFRNVRTYTEQAADGLIVVFKVVERQTIRHLKFIGNRAASDKKLIKETGLAVGQALNQFAVEEGQRKIQDWYHEKGYTKCEVSIFEGDKPEDQGVVYIITEGLAERILEVGFRGNTIATDARLKTQIQSKPGILYYFLRGAVDMKKIDEDIDRLTAYYRSLGYFRARVGRELQYTESGGWLKLTFVIDEGPRYKVRNVSVAGNQIYETDALLGQLQLKDGEFYNQAKMDRDLAILRDTYGSEGYIFADIQADPRFDEEPGALDLVYQIDEGEQWTVGRIEVAIEGEYPHTRQNVVLNRVSLRPGEIINIKEVRASERRLKSSQLFVHEPHNGITPELIIKPADLAGERAVANRAPLHRSQSPDEKAAPTTTNAKSRPAAYFPAGRPGDDRRAPPSQYQPRAPQR
jgi:outer membrane protein insertion porin family